MDKFQWDVIVVGAGNAALVSALSAHEHGAKVLILEAAPYEKRGGNSRFSGGLFRFAHQGSESVKPLISNHDWEDRVEFDAYPADQYYTEAMSVSDGRSDPELIRVLVDESFDTMSWLVGHGVRQRYNVGKNQSADYLASRATIRLREGKPVMSDHEGSGLVDDLLAAVEKAGIEIWYDSPGYELITSGSSVEGVRVRQSSKFVEVYGSVVLASGGFGANPELRRRYLGEGWDLVKVRGSRFNMGEMLMGAIDVGAQPVGHWGACHASPIDAAWSDYGVLETTDLSARYSYTWSIMVDVYGNRFLDEGENEHSSTYAKTGAAILRQPFGVAVQIFDQKSAHLVEPRYSTATPVVADTVEDLATQLGIPPVNLLRTVEEFNKAAPESGKFDPSINDGLGTKGLTPPKSNWAQRIDSPPYVAYRATCGLTFTYGGLKCNTDSQVLDKTDKPMPGLYAAGETQGNFFFYNYMAGQGLMRGAVFGRIAGREAAKNSKR